MFKINEHFDGDVVSISFQTETLPATVGVMAVGKYKFDTAKKETVTIISGALTVKLPGSNKWQIFSEGQQFIVEANQSFQLKVAVETSYLCTYSKDSNDTALVKSQENPRKISYTKLDVSMKDIKLVIIRLKRKSMTVPY